VRLASLWTRIFGSKAVDDELYRPRMPEVEVVPAIEDVFGRAREAARGETSLPDARPHDRHLVVVTPGRMLMLQACPPAGSMAAKQVASIEQMLPSAVPRAIAVIAYTELRAIETDFAKAIPFAGMLLGCAYVGHAVWVFEGHLSALVAGCRSADVLLVDGGMLPYLPADWATVGASAMRRKEIYVHDRATFRLTRTTLAS
jgi:hypothetical protein